MTKRSNFMRGEWSFRYRTMNGRDSWAIYPKGERSHWSQAGSIDAATDGTTFIIHPRSGVTDARPSFDAAVEHVLTLLPA